MDWFNLDKEEAETKIKETVVEEEENADGDFI